MRRIVTAAALTGVGVLVARAVIPKLKLHERGMAGCERMFEQMPEDFPPKRMMRGIEEIRAHTARTGSSSRAARRTRPSHSVRSRRLRRWLMRLEQRRIRS